MESLEAMGFETATPIQIQAMPSIMEGRDILACAQTGTGKTAAFLLPILNELTKNPNEEGVDTIIMEPTRELAVQVDNQLEALSYFTGISSIAVYGGRDGPVRPSGRIDRGARSPRAISCSDLLSQSACRRRVTPLLRQAGSHPATGHRTTYGSERSQLCTASRGRD